MVWEEFGKSLFSTSSEEGGETTSGSRSQLPELSASRKRGKKTLWNGKESRTSLSKGLSISGKRDSYQDRGWEKREPFANLSA